MNREFKRGVKKLVDDHKAMKIREYSHIINGRPMSGVELIDDDGEFAILIDNCACNFYGKDINSAIIMCNNLIYDLTMKGIDVSMTLSRRCGYNDNYELIKGREITIDELMLTQPDKLYLYLYDGAVVYGFTSNDGPATSAG